MTLADWEIRREIQRARLVVDPAPDLDGNALQPASLELRLDRHFAVLSAARASSPYIDPAEDNAELFQPVTVTDGQAFVLRAGECALAATHEWVSLPPDIVGRFEGKSSIGRLFLLTHATAGFIDPGFSGQITLELVNLGPLPIRLHPGMRIGQLALERLSAAAERPYGSSGVRSHYQGQAGPTVSQSWRGFTAGLPAPRSVR